MILNVKRVEGVAAAVDAVTEADGLNCGEALWVFTSMLTTTLEAADEEVRDAMRDAVIESLRAKSLKPLAELMSVSLPPQTH